MIARVIGAKMLGLPSVEDLNTYPYFKHIKSEGSIGIEQIRSIQQFVQLRTVGAQPIRRIIVVEDAHAMTLEAQNALLKILEEPPADTCIILTVQGEKSLKPTIYSRVQVISNQPPKLDAAIEYFVKLGKAVEDIKKAFLVADGGVGLMQALLDSESESVILGNIEIAKKLMSGSTYDRLLQIDQLSKDKDNLQGVVYALKRISTAALEGSALRSDQKQFERWYKVLQNVYSAEASLVMNPNSKLLLTRLFLAL